MSQRTKTITLAGDPDAPVPDRRSASDYVYEHVKRLIISGSLKGGERIPEKVVAAHFNVSRTPVREALLRLCGYGLVVIKAKPWSYAYVASITAAEARDIFEVRLWLERLAFRKARERLDKDLRERLYGFQKECREASLRGDYATAFEQDSLMHLGIAEATGNKELLASLSKIDAKIHLVRANRRLSPQEMQETFDQHGKLLELLEAGSFPELDALLEQHILHHLDI